MSSLKQIKKNSEINSKYILLKDAKTNSLINMELEAIISSLNEEEDVIQIGFSKTEELPICIVENINKYLFKLNKKKDNKNNISKEIKIRSKSDIGDIDVKLNRVKDFIKKGTPVRIIILKHYQAPHLSLITIERIKIRLIDFNLNIREKSGNYIVNVSSK